MKAITPPTCYCGAQTVYQDSKDYYHGKSYGMRWICERWPQCHGSVGAHPDGTPLGTIPDGETKALRSQCHAVADPIWRDSRFTAAERRYLRGSVYRWMQAITGLSQDECHIGMFDAEQCRYLLKRMTEVPYEKRKELLPREV